MARVSDEYVRACAVEQGLVHSLGLDRPIAEGQAYPIMTPEYCDVGDRTEVLWHQLELLRADSMRRLGLDDAEGT